MAVCLMFIGWGSVAAAEPSLRDRQVEFFESRIRPVLVEHCYECHNNAEKKEGGLAVDSRDGLLKGGDSGPALLAGQPQNSLLIQAVRHQLDGYEMPKAAPGLSETEIADLETWIRSGAVDPRDQPSSAAELAQATAWETVLQKRKQWWSFQPLGLDSPPVVSDEAWCNNEIDRFLLSRLEKEGLAPAPAADAETLIRRAFFTLTGLPPQPEEISRWQPLLETGSHEQQQQAFAQLVDDLLSRPEFGEHWARHWMDWIRYAETHGSEGDPEIGQAWQYRDYLVRAFNADIPYDQLVREQIAGDLLEEPRLNSTLQINESMIGPAHWRMVFHGFTPTDALDEKVRFIDDEINVFSKAFLGLTVACARCHNHKFDAISQADYYALFGVLGSCRPGRNVIDLPLVQERNLSELNEIKSDVRQRLADQWLKQLPESSNRWFSTETPIDDASVLALWKTLQQRISEGVSPSLAWEQQSQEWKSKQQLQARFAAASHFKSWELSDPAQAGEWFKSGQGLSAAPSAAGEFTISLSGETILSGLLPRGLYSNAISPQHGARLNSPDMQLADKYDVWLQICGDGGAVARYVVQQYPRNGIVYPIALPQPQWHWVRLDLSYWKGDEAYIELATAQDAPVPSGTSTRSWFGIRSAYVTPQGTGLAPTDFAEKLAPIFNSAEQPAVQSLSDVKQIYIQATSTAVQAWKSGSLSDAQAVFLDAMLKEKLLPNTFSSLPELRASIEEYRGLEVEIRVPQRVPGLQETVGRDQPLLIRGDHKKPGELIPRRFLEAIDSTPYRSFNSGRRQLAEDVLSEKNPLTRRVIVNRVWHHLFGQGLVRTPDNFGRMGEQPSHPELLDWLAVRFPKQGWSFKTLIREIVLTRTWQLSSVPSAESLTTDPDNRFLSHAHVRRLEAESIRDALLLASGRLDKTAAGPPVAGSSNRRSIYMAVKRNSLDPFLRVFDFPEPFSTTGRRDVTNVPAQSLTMMNDEQIVSCGNAWANLIESRQLSSNEERLKLMFLQAFARSPSTEEMSRSTAFLQQTQQLHEEFHGKRLSLSHDRDQLSKQIDQLFQAARERMTPGGRPAIASPPRPTASWNFAENFNDEQGLAPAHAVGKASLQNGGLNTNEGSYAITEPLGIPLKEKTLEAWGQLASLEQQGGGVISIQSTNGAVFDSIVFGEMSPGEWLSGSDYFHRTKSLRGFVEKEAANRPVHLAATYQSNGIITFYRDGTPYGTPYQSAGPAEFKAGETVVTFGLRHLPANGQRALKGKILRARLYDHALSPEEVRLSFLAHPQEATEQQLWEQLTPVEQAQVTALRHKREDVIEELKTIPATGENPRQAAWANLARALFLMKEFVYLK